MSSASTAANAIYIETSYRGTRVFQSWGDKLGVQLDRVSVCPYDYDQVLTIIISFHSTVELHHNAIGCFAICSNIPASPKLQNLHL